MATTTSVYHRDHQGDSDGRRAQPFRNSGLAVTPQALDHLGAGHAHERRERGEPERDDGQHHVQGSVAARGPWAAEDGVHEQDVRNSRGSPQRDSNPCLGAARAFASDFGGFRVV